ncbi:MAG: oligosaccharide repeat unit polymerase, partial [Candidatus Methanofastidiosia archaeon]
VSKQALSKYDVMTTFSLIPNILRRAFDAITLEFEKSSFRRASDRFFISLFNLPSLKPKLAAPFLEKKGGYFLTPIMFIVAFIMFLGLSDHGISTFALLSIILAFLAFGAGMAVARKVHFLIPDKFIPYLLIVLLATLVGTFIDWGTWGKISFVPLGLLILAQKHSLKISLAAAVSGYILFNQGWWAIGFPYFALGILGIIYNLKDKRIAQFLEKNAYFIAFLLIFIGTLYWVLDIAIVEKIPLLTSREGLDPTFTMRSHLLPIGTVLLVSLVGAQAKKSGEYGKSRFICLIFISFSTILMALLGYRTQVMITLVASIITALFWNLVTVTELFASGIAILAFFATMTFLRTHTTGAHIGVIESISLRTGLTLDVYDTMANLGGYMGFTKGQTYLATIRSFATLMPGLAYAPRRYIAVFTGARGISMTSTILGPIAIDFGLFGTIVFMVVLGFFLQKTYQLVKATTGKRRSYISAIYGLTLGYSIIGIETGLVDYEVIVLFALSILYILYISNLSENS